MPLAMRSVHRAMRLPSEVAAREACGEVGEAQVQIVASLRFLWPTEEAVVARMETETESTADPEEEVAVSAASNREVHQRKQAPLERRDTATLEVRARTTPLRLAQALEVEVVVRVASVATEKLVVRPSVALVPVETSPFRPVRTSPTQPVVTEAIETTPPISPVCMERETPEMEEVEQRVVEITRGTFQVAMEAPVSSSCAT